MNDSDHAHQAAVYEPPPDEGLQAVYLDEHLLVVNKPAGLLTVPGRGDHLQDCLIHRVQHHVPEALIVHRLDMATSGLVVLARGPDMQRALSQAFMNRQVYKRYEAVVWGNVAQDEGTVDAPLITDWPRRPRQMVDWAQGKPSQTVFRVTERLSDPTSTRVSLEPLTGRSHQLRVHMLTLGHAILGDPLYGPLQAQQASTRLLLHACELKLPHPCSDQGLHLTSISPF
jgi:tRNA pseudouridine32 synthase / 23S rRNA pseudouridine746 synthase